MMKSLLKQVSVVVFCTVISVSPVWAGSSDDFSGILSNISTAKDLHGTFSNADSAVDATKFFKGKKDSKKFLALSAWLGVDLVSDKQAYKDVHKQIKKLNSKDYVKSFDVDGKALGKGATGYIDKVKNEFADGVRGNLSTLTELDVKQLGKDMSQDIKTKAKDIATGKELKRLINEEVIDAMSAEAERTSKVGEGIPTVDIANIATGMFNLDSVFGTYHADEGVRDEDTRSCSAMGISAVTPDGPYAALMKQAASAIPGVDTDSPGFQCCLKWSAAQESKLLQSASGSGGISKSGSSLIQSMKKCCSLSPELCFGVHAEKTECVNNKLSSGSSLGDGLKACSVECGKDGYGELKHMDGEKYDPKDVDELVKKCEKQKTNWAPSPTVLTADELAPVVPNYVKSKLSN